MSNFIFSFYIECLLPELVSPQYGKRLLVDDILDPQYILENIKTKLSNEKNNKTVSKCTLFLHYNMLTITTIIIL